MPDTNIPLRTDISPSLRGSWFREIYAAALGDIAEGKAILVHGAAALDPMYVTLGAINDAHRAATAAAVPAPIAMGMRPAATTKEEQVAAGIEAIKNSAPGPKPKLDPSHENSLRRLMTAAFAKTAPRIDANLSRMRAAQKALEDKLERALDVDSSHADSTRHFLTRDEEGRKAKKGSAYTKAIGLIGSAGEREVKAIAGALLGVPSFLTGLDQKQETAVRAAVARRIAPKEFAAVEAAGKAIAHVEQARATFISEYTRKLPKASTKTGAADQAFERLAAVQ
jgi:hypothetical protein